jgi:hypothetical protein
LTGDISPKREIKNQKFEKYVLTLSLSPRFTTHWRFFFLLARFRQKEKLKIKNSTNK